MGTQSEVKNEDGNVIAIRDVDDGGRQSRLYDYDDSIVSWLTGDHRGEKIEVADHDPDGTTRTYEPDDGFIASLTGDDRGEETTSSSSCCYIVSACLDDLGLPRSSKEMTAMKLLAKNYVLKTFSGKRDYLWYGKVAPKIVSSIRSKSDSRSIWEGVYTRLQNLAPIILSGNYSEGRQKYRGLVYELQDHFS